MITPVTTVLTDAPSASLIEIDAATGALVMLQNARLVTRDRAVIGRSRSCDLRFTSDARVSRRHARLSRCGDAWLIEDLHSTHGVYVDGARVRTCVLRGGEVVPLGDTTLRFQAGR